MACKGLMRREIKPAANGPSLEPLSHGLGGGKSLQLGILTGVEEGSHSAPCHQT